MRIISGRWRGRKLPVPDVSGLRPTGDRVRETVFNWLRDHVAGAHCLDLFAGSGALGFEALSRYAKSVSFVEPDAIACGNLRQSCKLLDVPMTGAPPVGHVTGDANAAVAYVFEGCAQQAIESWAKLDKAPQYDLVFIDPPFQMAVQWEILNEMVPGGLSDGALIYVESPLAQNAPEPLPPGCQLVREKRFGAVMARLLSYSSS